MTTQIPRVVWTKKVWISEKVPTPPLPTKIKYTKKIHKKPTKHTKKKLPNKTKKSTNQTYRGFERSNQNRTSLSFPEPGTDYPQLRRLGSLFLSLIFSKILTPTSSSQCSNI